MPTNNPDQYILVFQPSAGGGGGGGVGGDGDGSGGVDVGAMLLVVWTRAIIPELGTVCLPPSFATHWNVSSVLGKKMPAVHGTAAAAAGACTVVDLYLSQSPIYLHSV